MSDDPGIRRHIPNALTIARLVLAAVFFVVLGRTQPWPFAKDLTFFDRFMPAFEIHPGLIVAALIFIVAAITDALDGFLARRWNVVSRFGRVMDPFADKVLVLGAFVMLAGPNLIWYGVPEDHPPLRFTGVETWMVVVILARELLVTSLRGLVESEGKDFSATWSGKWKMILQSIAVPTILLTIAFWTPWPGSGVRLFLDILIWATVAVTVLSGVPYVRKAISQ